ncbi:hypothetical protein [Streptococcus massiliensis]|uniref:hypothetical protein n=1 Tax=Streptococcus massiliensis TaxID=313439 RepID=UPI001358D8F3|nr:hypothetical protein [Streptococcus massiliensis]
MTFSKRKKYSPISEGMPPSVPPTAAVDITVDIALFKYAQKELACQLPFYLA